MKELSYTFIETITNSIFQLKFKEKNENDMSADGICFDFYYRSKPNLTEWLLRLALLVTVKSTMEILQNYVAFSEYMNFM